MRPENRIDSRYNILYKTNYMKLGALINFPFAVSVTVGSQKMNCIHTLLYVKMI